MIIGILWSVACALQIAATVWLLYYGGTHLSQATEGVGIIAAACVAAIFARIAQAGANHAWLTDEIRKLRRTTVELADIEQEDQAALRAGAS